jgi:hypothetical protein
MSKCHAVLEKVVCAQRGRFIDRHHDLLDALIPVELTIEIDPTLLNRGRRIFREGVAGAEEEVFTVVAGAEGVVQERDGVRTLRLRVIRLPFPSGSSFRSFAVSALFGL